jgi:hypothetical protein
MSTPTELGKNVSYVISGTILTLTVDLSKEQGTSKSGKSNVIGTTSGNKKITYNEGTISIGLNVYKPVEDVSE